MRILVAGAGGVLGLATLPHLDEHDVVGLTRSREKLRLVREVGAAAVACDVYDYAKLVDVVRTALPQIVVNFLTDLSTRSGAANNRIRREGAANLLNAAEKVNARRLVVESVAFPLAGDAAAAVEELERSTRAFRGEALIIRFGRFWGPGTSYETAPEPPAVHIEMAGAAAARLIVGGQTGTHLVT